MPRTRHRRARHPIAATRGPRATFHILVATAGDPDSRAAIRLSALLAPRLHATVGVVTVVVPFPHRAALEYRAAPPPVIDEDNRRTAVAQVRAQLRSVRGAGKWRIESALGWPATTIPLAANKTGASLIVIGAGEHGILGRLLGSETAVGIAQRTCVPVLAVPVMTRGLPTHALAAVDFTDASVDAAMLAAHLVGAGGRVTLLHASMLVEELSDPGTLGDIYTAGVHAKLEQLAGTIHRATRVPVDTLVVHGEVVASILEQVQHTKCGLLAIGGHALSLLERLTLGSVRTKVLRRAPCPVLIAPTIAEPPG